MHGQSHLFVRGKCAIQPTAHVQHHLLAYIAGWRVTKIHTISSLPTRRQKRSLEKCFSSAVFVASAQRLASTLACLSCPCFSKPPGSAQSIGQLQTRPANSAFECADGQLQQVCG